MPKIKPARSRRRFGLISTQAEQAGDIETANQLAKESIELAKIKRAFQQKLASL